MSARTRRVAAAGLGALALGALGLGCGSSSSHTSSALPSQASGAVAVKTGEFFFAPKEVHIKAGATVSWTNSGKTTHTVKGPGFFSKALDPGKTYTHRFTKAGRYSYLCTLHPTLMRGTIVVG